MPWLLLYTGYRGVARSSKVRSWAVPESPSGDSDGGAARGPGAGSCRTPGVRSAGADAARRVRRLGFAPHAALKTREITAPAWSVLFASGSSPGVTARGTGPGLREQAE